MDNGKTTPRKVDLLHDTVDQDIFILGELGWSTQQIADKVGRTPCQVAYRLGRWEVKRSTYRHGGKIALAVFDMMRHLPIVRKPLEVVAVRLEKKVGEQGGVKA